MAGLLYPFILSMVHSRLGGNTDAETFADKNTQGKVMSVVEGWPPGGGGAGGGGGSHVVT